MTARILVAEPSRTLASLIRLTLSGLDAELEIRRDGREAYHAARDRLPDLLIVDADLAGLDGYALAASVRRLEGGRHLPILLTLSDQAQPDAERLAYIGIDDVLTKPFERKALLERVRALLPQGGPAARPALAAPRTHHTPTPAPWTAPSADPIAAGGTTPEVEIAELVTEAVQRELKGTIDALVRGAVGSLLPAIVREALPHAIETALGELDPLERRAIIRDSVDAIAAEAIPHALRDGTFQVAPKIDAAIHEAIPPMVRAAAEPVIWKVVPELAEDLIRDEIRRLTEEPHDD